MKSPRIKICCIQSLAEARLAIRYGATELGFVSHMPSGPGVISENKIAEIIQHVPPSVNSVLLTSKQTVSDIVEQEQRCQADFIQLCDHLNNDVYAQLKEALPDVLLMHVIHINSEADIAEAIEMQHKVDMLLLDSGSKTATTKILGGTGKIHDWRISKKIVEQVSVPVFLAGGLNPENVAEAMKAVNPDGLDVCTGVRTDWCLAEAKLEAFTGAISRTAAGKTKRRDLENAKDRKEN
jgi:phosphoribosylanthranilate isomerase